MREEGVVGSPVSKGVLLPWAGLTVRRKLISRLTAGHNQDRNPQPSMWKTCGQPLGNSAASIGYRLVHKRRELYLLFVLARRLHHPFVVPFDKGTKLDGHPPRAAADEIIVVLSLVQMVGTGRPMQNVHPSGLVGLSVYDTGVDKPSIALLLREIYQSVVHRPHKQPRVDELLHGGEEEPGERRSEAPRFLPFAGGHHDGDAPRQQQQQRQQLIASATRLRYASLWLPVPG